MAERYSLHPATIEACLDPEHLPRVERIGDTDFLMLRGYDATAPADAEDIPALTRKIAVFSNPRFLITVHRADLPWVSQVRAKWGVRPAQFTSKARFHMLGDLLSGTIDSFEAPIERAFERSEELEDRLFREKSQREDLEEIYSLRRRIATLKRLLRLTVETLPKLPIDSKPAEPFFRGIRDHATSLYHYLDDLQENLQQLLHLQLSLSSQRTNESMRVLTVFSAFFLPLSFIAGVYGMNFRWMPEIEWRQGYPYALGLMAVVALGIGLWFRRRGWLDPG